MLRYRKSSEPGPNIAGPPALTSAQNAGWEGSRSKLDVKCVPEGSIELDLLFESEPTYGFGLQVALRHCHDVVARDHACFWQAFVCADLDFRTNVANRSCDGCARKRKEHLNGRVPGQDADRTGPGRRPEISPDDVAPGYHCGVVRVARRRAAMTSAGSWGTRRYASCSS